MFFNNYKQLSVDSKQLLGAANVLDVTEFRLFELAYQEWFGRRAIEAELEKTYALYWFTGLAPIWVRHYSRNVLTLSHEVGHEVSALAAPREMSIFQLVILGCLAVSVLLLMTVR